MNKLIILIIIIIIISIPFIGSAKSKIISKVIIYKILFEVTSTYRTPCSDFEIPLNWSNKQIDSAGGVIYKRNTKVILKISKLLRKSTQGKNLLKGRSGIDSRGIIYLYFNDGSREEYCISSTLIYYNQCYYKMSNQLFNYLIVLTE